MKSKLNVLVRRRKVGIKLGPQRIESEEETIKMRKSICPLKKIRNCSQRCRRDHSKV